MSLSARTTKEALAYANHQHDTGTLAWAGMCQKFCRSAYGIGSLYGSAWAQWLACDPEDKHPGSDPSKAPVGSALLFRGGSKGYGHIMLAAHDFPSGRSAAWSNDLVKTGRIDKVHRNAPETQWNQVYVGYITAINDVDLRMPQKQHYGGLLSAIRNVENALDTARNQSDANDVKVLTTELTRLKGLYDNLRRV